MNAENLFGYIFFSNECARVSTGENYNLLILTAVLKILQNQWEASK